MPNVRGKDKKKRKELSEEEKEKKRQRLAEARKKSPMAKKNLPLEGEAKEYNSKMINFMLDIIPTEPLDRDDIPEMERRFVKYLQKCEEWGVKPANMSAYCAIGLDKDQVHVWLTREKGTSPRVRFIKKVKQICSMARENMVNDGKINPVVYIFQAKNYDGMRDQQEIVTHHDDDSTEIDNDRLKKKYMDNAIDGEFVEAETTEKD